MRLKRFAGFGRDDRGSFTIEATLVFPIVMICTLTLLFLGLFVYQKVVVQHIARSAAERLAFTWDNSRKDLASGNFNPGETDGLYWRLTQDSVSDLFGLLVSGRTVEVALPGEAGKAAGQVEKKLAKSSALLPSGITGTARYKNFVLDRQIEVELNKPFLMPPFVARMLGSALVSGKAVSHVIEPVELIRLTDITRTYIKAIKGRISPQKAKAALVEPAYDDGSGPSVTIRSEREAARYLQALTGGKEVKLVTLSGKSRTVDALDSNGVAHQAFYTFTEPQLLADQLPKDMELLQEGKQVKGVVWHFFKKSANGKGVPSAQLRRELEQKGIVVVVHN